MNKMMSKKSYGAIAVAMSIMAMAGETTSSNVTLNADGDRRGKGAVSIQAGDAFARQRAEFAKYHRAITGRDAPADLVTFAIDPKVSQRGRDAFTVKSEGAGVKITGSNERSVWFGLYDLLERRGGCRWFWDGDVVPKAAKLDLANLDYRDEAHFEYRAIRYFAHRGLSRFQAELWGIDDWKREIDWCLKRKLNTFMLRIGQDDLFQRTFPETCAYPDPAKPLPGRGKGYDDRSLFWSLQFRGKLRQDLQRYGRERGLMIPEDFGTMTHWYSRTPEDFLAKKKPDFLPNIGHMGEANGLVWDIRGNSRWADEYWKMTKTAVEVYGEGAAKQQLLHTIGLGERRVYRDRKRNFELKCEALRMFIAHAVAKGPGNTRIAYSPAEKRRRQLLERGIEPFKPTLPRTEANYHRVMNEIVDLLKRN